MTPASVVVLLLTAAVIADQSPSFKHVRASRAEIREAITDGYARSASFKALVDRVDALSCVVFVEPMVRLSRGSRGVLLHMPVGKQQAMPVLRVLLKTNQSRDESIVVIGHEL